jgi:hypothetical protein
VQNLALKGPLIFKIKMHILRGSITKVFDIHCLSIVRLKCVVINHKKGEIEEYLGPLRACLGISGMKGNEGHWGGEISIISQNFPKSPSILFHPLESSISQTSPKWVLVV